MAEEIEDFDLAKELRLIVTIQSICLLLACFMVVVLVLHYDYRVKAMQKQLAAQEAKIEYLEQKELPALADETRVVLKKYEQVYSGILQGIKEEW